MMSKERMKNGNVEAKVKILNQKTKQNDLKERKGNAQTEKKTK